MANLVDQIFAREYKSFATDFHEPEYNPPAEFTYAEPVLVATIPKDPLDGDGQHVEIYETRYPATFWEVVVLATQDSMGEMQPGFSISTGSGFAVGRLAFPIARAIAEGMLGFHPQTTEA